MNEILIEKSAFETRIAVLEDERLVEVLHERPETKSLVGSLYLGKVGRVLPGMDAVFVNIGFERDAYLHASELSLETDDDSNDRRSERSDVRARLGSRRELIVQITRDPMPQKGPRVTTYPSLAGQLVVLLPKSSHRGVSRQIEEPDERQRLLDAASQTETPGGWIVRTAARGVSEKRLINELERLTKSWQDLLESAATQKPPTLLRQEADLCERAVRDLVDPQTHSIRIEGLSSDAEIQQLAERYRNQAVQWIDEPPGLLQRSGVEKQVDRALLPRVWLKRGGSIVIEPTEAMVSIDVNTGSFVGSSTLAETVLATNLEAASEIAYQLRLRNLGGLIVIDFIDMTSPVHRTRVVTALKAALARDRANTRVLNVSAFGLVEVTRKQDRSDLANTLTARCPTCRGSGRVRSLTSLCINLRRELLRGPSRPQVRLEVHPLVARALSSTHSERIDEISKETRTTIEVASRTGILPGAFHLLEA